ncbi:MAG: hypothetical protein M1825_002168 [Sarcosagium campestre]|nr:MAG: hypothetical protein M1825_002168 [Sarcosagium campestre]
MAADPTALTEVFEFESIYRIAWTRLGPASAPPLIFIHGTPWSSRLWVPFALAFAASHSVYLFDNPGYGESQTSGQGTVEQGKDSSLAKQAASFAALYRHWKLDRPPHVIAHDNGGLVSLRANIQHGCVYRSLCLVDVVAAPPFEVPLFELIAANEEVFQQLPLLMFEGIIRSYIRNAAFKPLSLAAEESLARQWLSEDGKKGFIRQLVQASGRHAEDVITRYGEVGASGIPIKIIWGKEDKWLSVDRAETLQSMIGGRTEVVLVDDASHLIHLDQPERLMAELMRFVLAADK